MTQTDWTGTAARITRLAATPGADDIFGAGAHQWQLQAPLTAAELTAVETQLRVALPGEYRSFLLQVSRGGAGPAYGLFPVREIDGIWQWSGDGADLTDYDTLARPFPHTEAFDPAAGLPEPPYEEDFASEDLHQEAEDAYWERRDAVVNAPEHSVGLLYLCHLGCALREALVVSGPARGQMWADDTAEDKGFRPLRHADGRRFGFADWYGDWLRTAEQNSPSSTAD